MVLIYLFSDSRATLAFQPPADNLFLSQGRKTGRKKGVKNKKMKKKKLFLYDVNPCKLRILVHIQSPTFYKANPSEVGKYKKPNCYNVSERFNIQLSAKLFKSKKLILLLNFYAHYS